MPTEYFKPYSMDRELTGETLLELAQSHKLYSMKTSFGHDLGLSDDIRVSQADIEVMGETLKSIVFFIPINAFRRAVELAKERGVLIKDPRWVKNG